MTESFFLVLEGMDGSGKSEISRRLTEKLSTSLGAEQVLHTYEPHNDSAAGEYIRDVLGKRITISARTLALAFALNRADHNERMIAPFLDGDSKCCAGVANTLKSWMRMAASRTCSMGLALRWRNTHPAG
jgi:thymidylate kinase